MGYPHDEFDDVPEDSARRGAYRGVAVDSTRSTKKTLAAVIAGIIALVVGGIMFVVSPRLSTPEASSTLPMASNTASASASASADASSSKTGMVYNDGAYQGAAGQAATVLGNNGYTITESANWKGTPVNQSVIFYSAGHANEAEEVAKLIGVSYIQEDTSTELEFYVVLAADYAGLPNVAGEVDQVYDLSATTDSTATDTTDSSDTNTGTDTSNQQPGAPGDTGVMGPGTGTNG